MRKGTRLVVVDTVVMDTHQLQRLQSFGSVVIYEGYPKDREEMVRRIGDAQIVLNGGSKMDAETLERSPNLEMISIWSTGYDHIDVAAAKQRGIVVTNVPGGTGNAVAEHVFALVFALLRDLVQADRHVREGGYDWQAYTGIELRGKTFGVIGTGDIGSGVARIARCLGCRVIATTRHPSLEQAKALGVQYVNLESLLMESDVICVCVSLNAETEDMIGWREFEMMVRKPILMNIARGRVIDQKALLRALRTGLISGAGLDVLAQEPPDPADPLLSEKNVVFTPHCAGSTVTSLHQLTEGCLDNIVQYMAGNPQNVVS